MDLASAPADLASSPPDLTTATPCTVTTQCSASDWCNPIAGVCQTSPKLRGAHFAPDTQRVFIVGDNGTILSLPNAAAAGPANWVVANSGTTAPLYSVYGLTGTDYWTVGGGGTILHTTNGTTWSPVASGTTADLYGTHSSTNNGGQVVRRMVGANGIRLGILGVGSTTVTVDNTPLGTSTLTAVIIRGGTNVQSYAVGLGGIFQNESSGTGWGAPTMVPGASDLYAVNTVGSDVWIVGQNGKAFRSQSGGAYQSIATGTTANLHAVDSTGGEVWAVGDNNTVIRYTGGASFTPVPGVNCPATSTNFLAVELEGTNNLWLVGDSGAVCWYNGTAWVNRSLHP